MQNELRVALNERGVSFTSEESLLRLYWSHRFSHAPAPTDAQVQAFINSNIQCVHCRAGAVFRNEPTMRE